MVAMKRISQIAHIIDRVRKGATIIGQVWGIGKRRFGKDTGDGRSGYLIV